MQSINYAHIDKRRCVGDVQPGWYYNLGDAELDGERDVWQRDLDAAGWCGPYRTEAEARTYAEADAVLGAWLANRVIDDIKIPPSLIEYGVHELVATYVDTHGGARSMVTIFGGEYLPDDDLHILLRAARLDAKAALRAIDSYLKREGQ